MLAHMDEDNFETANMDWHGLFTEDETKGVINLQFTIDSKKRRWIQRRLQRTLYQHPEKRTVYLCCEKEVYMKRIDRAWWLGCQNRWESLADHAIVEMD